MSAVVTANNQQPQGLSILVADGDPGVHKHFAQTADQSQCKLSFVDTSSAALEASRSGQFDLLVVDASLDGEATIDFIRSIQKLYPSQALIVAAPNPSLESIILYLREGAMDVFNKPVPSAEFHSVLSRITPVARCDLELHRSYQLLAEECGAFRAPVREFAREKFVLPILRKLERAGVVEKACRLKLELAFDEALTNAIEHGALELESSLKDKFGADGLDLFSTTRKQRLASTQYSERMIEAAYQIQDWVLTMNISYEGPGFVPPLRKTVKEESNPVDIKTYGRGMAILFSTLDEVAFRPDGRSVTLIKKLR